MSGSPKYNSVSLAEARRAKAEAERAERARRREQERQRRLAAAVRRAKNTAERRCASVVSRYSALRDAATQAGFGAAVTAQAATSGRVAAEIAAATDHPAVAAANRKLDALERQIESLSTAVGLRQEAAAARLTRLTASLEQIPRTERLHLDSRGGHAAETAVGQARAAEHASGPEAGPPGSDTQLDTSVAAAAEIVAEHLERVRIAQAERTAQLRDAEFRIEDLRSRLELLETEGRDLRVEVDGAQPAHEYLDRLHRSVAEGRTDELAALLPRVAAAIDRTESKFDTAVGRVVERRRILTSIVASLPDLGFGVIPDSLTVRPDGSVSVRARTTLGQTLDVLVQDGGQGADEVLYSSSDLAAEELAGGISGGTCGTLLEVIGTLNEKAERDGYITGAVSWDDGPDPDPDHTAALRPAAAPQAHKAGG